MNGTSLAQQGQQQTIGYSCSDFQSVKAEIIWTLKTVMSEYSIRSIVDLIETLPILFPECKITTNVDLARTKSTM